MRAGPDIAWSQDFISGAGTNFDLVGTLQMVVVRETPGSHVWHIGQVLCLQGVYRFESPRHSQI
jgi:hypothetical protein